MSKVVAFRDNTIPGEPNADLVDELERLLAEAKSGDLEAFAYCTVRNGAIGTGWVGGSGSRGNISSAVLMLGHRYAAALLGDEQ